MCTIVYILFWIYGFNNVTCPTINLTLILSPLFKTNKNLGSEVFSSTTPKYIHWAWQCFLEHVYINVLLVLLVQLWRHFSRMLRRVLPPWYADNISSVRIRETIFFHKFCPKTTLFVHISSLCLPVFFEKSCSFHSLYLSLVLNNTSWFCSWSWSLHLFLGCNFSALPMPSLFFP